MIQKLFEFQSKGASKASAAVIRPGATSHLSDVDRREKENRWRNEHADFVAAYNASIEAEGLPLYEWRTF
jgi:antitoxin CcdA